MIKLYGISTSRTLRPLWLLEEIGVEYEHIPVDFRKGENRDPDFLKINPNGKLPALVDDDLVMFESMAINLYLAKKYGGDLYPQDEADEAITNMWSFWVMSEVEYDLLTILLHRRIFAEADRDSGRADRAEKRLKTPMTILNDALNKKDYLLGDSFTVVDLNVAAVLSWCKPARVTIKEWPHLGDWLGRCISRPAFKIAVRKP